MTDDTSYWRGRSVLVTGCTGFLGSWLCRRLCAEGASVVGLSRGAAKDDHAAGGPEVVPVVDLVRAGLEDRDAIRETASAREVDTVFHLAAQSVVAVAAVDPGVTFEVNVAGTWNLLESLRQSGRPVRVVVASSDAVYGDQGTEAHAESSPTAGTPPYAVSKICAEALARSYRRHFGLRVAVARTSNLYGGGDLHFDRVVPGTIRSVLREEEPVIRSDGTPERDYLYVEDAVDGYLRIARALDEPEVPAWTFNLSSETPLPVSGVVSTVLARMGRPDLKPRVLGRPTEGPSRIHTSCTRAREMLGWPASTPLETGLDKTIPWYRAHAEEVRP